jgi:flagella basal body P-ring formation protein FlgA
MERAIARYLESRLDGRVSDVEVSLVDPQDPLTVPGGILDVQVTGSGSDDVVGRRHFRLSVAVDGKEVSPLPVTADVSLLAEVVAATRMIKSDELIEADDVTVKRVKVNSLRHDFVSDVNDAIGKSASRMLQPQAPIRTSALMKPYAVRKGDRVTIEAKRGGLLIQTVGVTKAAAQLGQFVTITNQDSGKELRGKVVGPGLVQVEF